jgi:NAD(P)-dependent dehydrogenase (short-subunit alcohol dehydrogenase family)
MPLEEYQRIVAINGLGAFLCMKHEIRAMLKTGGGAIVNISSGAGMGGLPHQSAYTAGKHACLGLTRTAALEYAQDNIRVNSVAPGVIDTPLNAPGPYTETLVSLVPMKRMGTTQEIAEACLWLCSEASSYITGQALGVCGGFNRVAASGAMPGSIGIE